MTGFPKDEVLGMEDLLDSYPDFEHKYTPSGLVSYGNDVKFLVDNSNSLVP